MIIHNHQSLRMIKKKTKRRTTSAEVQNVSAVRLNGVKGESTSALFVIMRINVCMWSAGY